VVVYELHGINQQLFHSTMAFQKRTNYFTLALDKHSKMTAELTRQTKSTGHNSTYPKGGVSCSKDSFVVNRTLVFQIKFCGKNPALRVAAKR
jgi:hypothetical protein